jgi:hypothetical protein
MIYRIRLLAAILVVEIGLGILWWNLMQPATRGASPISAERAARLGEIMGTAMGAIFGFACLLYFVARANDRRRTASRRS